MATEMIGNARSWAYRQVMAESKPPAGGGDHSPYLSVVVPAHRSSKEFGDALRALLDSDFPRDEWNLIVVVDGGDAAAAELAATLADLVVTLPGKARGPSYARNRGAEVATGEILVFIDADVRVHRDTLRCFAELFRTRSDLSAAFGSYDDKPTAPGIVSKYRNLLHHSVHQQESGAAETFWAGCGAIRRSVFHDVGMYDEWHFSRPQIEDIELGRRLRLRGHRILLRPEIQATHLKIWTLRGVLEADLKDRGIPWARLILHEGRGVASRTLNVRPSHRWCAALSGIALVCLPLAAALGSLWPLLGVIGAMVGLVAINRHFYALLWRQGGWRLALGSVPLHLLHYLVSAVSAGAAWVCYQLVGCPQPPPGVAALSEVGAETWPPLPSKPTDSVWYRHGS